MRNNHYNKLKRKRAQNHYDRVKQVKQKHDSKNLKTLFDIV